MNKEIIAGDVLDAFVISPEEKNALFNDEIKYQSEILFFKQLLENDIITPEDYNKIVTILKEKMSPILSTL